MTRPADLLAANQVLQRYEDVALIGAGVLGISWTGLMPLLPEQLRQAYGDLTYDELERRRDAGQLAVMRALAAVREEQASHE